MLEKGLGFYPGPVDERDWKLGAFLARETRPKTTGSRWWQNLERLDQGREGACVGFGWTQRVNAAPKQQRLDNAYARDLYKLAQTLDPWPGEDYEGTSVRAGGDAARQQGIISGYAFSTDLEEIAAWILNKGPVVIGVDWHEGMSNPSRENNYFIEPTGAVRGGHAICVDGVWFNRDNRDYFRLLNSWGPGWGNDGRCKLKWDDMAKLLSKPYAACATAVEV